MPAALLLLLLPCPLSLAQQAGTVAKEAHPLLTVRRCADSECLEEDLELTLDAQYRWLHDADGYDNCFDADKWDKKLCPSGVKCAKNCAIDGVDKKGYPKTYGVSKIASGVELTFAVKGEYGTNYGSRVYAMEGEDKYKMFKLKNREFTFEVDVSKLPCGLNGAAYFVAMDSAGDLGKGHNEAGAKYGLGYCDAQCPRGQKFVKGVANVKGWDQVTSEGNVGACCAELDLFEANANSSAMTVHPCASAEQYTCDKDECAEEDICDKDGCQYNPYHMGNPWFYGPGDGFTIDTTKKFKVVTQFLTTDGTDDGDLSEIRRFYMQDGNTWAAPDVAGPEKKDNHVHGNSLSDEYCSAKNGEKLFGADGRRLGKGHSHGSHYMKKMGEALDRGMVLILSVWDDPATNMAWLDASSLVGQSESKDSQVWKGPCFEESADVRTSAPDSSVKFSNIAYGDLFSTCPSCKHAETPTKHSKSKTPRPTEEPEEPEEPIIVPVQPSASSTEPPWVFDQSTTTSPPKPTPLIKNAFFVFVLVLGGAAMVVFCAWSYLKAQGWEMSTGRTLGAPVPGSPISPSGGGVSRSLVRPSE